MPRYMEIRQTLADRILSGDWRPGHRVPSEHELMKQYGCSRMTVNKALSALSTAGLIVRKRKSGSFVASPQAQQTVLEIHDIRAEVTARGHRYGHEVLSRRIRLASRIDIERLGLETKSRVLELTVLHYASGTPIVLESRIISLSSVPEAESERYEDVPPGTWLLKRIPWSEAEHTIRAVPANADTAARLGVPQGTACLVMERKTWRSGVPVTWVRLNYLGDQQKLVARFTPGTPHAEATASAPAR